MVKSAIFWLLALSFSISSPAASINMVTLKELLDAIQNLTTELDDVDSLGNKFYKFATDNQQYFVKLAELPDQMAGLNGNINMAVPAVERSAYVLGACIVGAAVICITPQVVRYFINRYRKRHEPLLEEVQAQ